MSNSDLDLAIRLSTNGNEIVVKNLRQVDAETDKLNRSLHATGKSGVVASSGLKQASSSSEALTTSLRGMVAQTAGVLGVGYAINQISEGLYNGIDAFQGYRGQLKTITGDYGSANVEFERLIALSKETPFTLDQSIEGFTKLTHLGLNPSREAMLSYGNTSSAMGKDLMQMIEAVADASTFEFERLKEFGIKAKQQKDTVSFTFQGITTTVAKNAENIQQYLLNIGNVNFAGAMSDQMDRLSAKSSNLETSIAQLYDLIGGMGASNLIGSGLDGFAEQVDDINTALKAMDASELQDLVATISAVAGTGAALLILKALNVNVLRLATSSVTATQAIMAKTAAMTKGSVTTNIYGQVTSRVTAKTITQTAATRALTVAIRTLLGPIGLAVAAGYALYEAFAPSELDKSTAALNRMTAAFDGLSQKRQEDESYKLQLQINEKTKEHIALYKKMIEQRKYAESAIGTESYSAFLHTLNATEKAYAAVDAELSVMIDSQHTMVGTIMEGTLAFGDAKEASDKKTDATTAELTANQKLISSLGVQITTLGMSTKEKLLFTNMSKLSANATQAEKDAVKALTASLFEQKELQAQAKQEDDFYQSAIDGINGYSDAWAGAGNVIIDTFGNIGQQAEKLFIQQEAYNKAIEINHKKQKDQGADVKKLKAEELKLNHANTQAQINSYSSIAGAAGDMFSKNSKAAEVAYAIEDALAVASLAMSVEKMIMSTTETGVVVANETTKQAALGTTAIITQGQGDPYTAWARIAAMVALVAGLGIATSGSGGSTPDLSVTRQESQGTGTLLGSDEKSQSLLNSYERIEELELDQYAELQQMNSHLSALNNNITRLATRLVQGFGNFGSDTYQGELGEYSTTSKLEDFLLTGGFTSEVLSFVDPTGLIDSIVGSFSSTKKSLVDSGISIVSQTMGDIVDGGMLDMQAYYDIKIKNKKFWGASSKTSYKTEYDDVDASIEREFGLVFEHISGSINEAVNMLGDDVSKNLDNYVIDLPNISFKDLSGDEIEAELQAVLSQQADLMATYMLPSITEFQRVGEGLYDTLIRVAQETVVFTSFLSQTSETMNGLANNDGSYNEHTARYGQQIIEDVGGLDKFTEYASSYYDEFFSDEEKFKDMEQNVTAIFADLNRELPATKEGFRALIESVNVLYDNDGTYAELLKLNPLMAEYYDALKQQNEAEQERTLILQEELAARESFTLNIAEQLAALDMSPLEIKLKNLQDEFDSYYREAESVGASTALLDELYAEKRYQLELGNYNSLKSAIDSLKASAESLLLSDLSTLTGQERLTEAEKQYSAVLALAQAGDSTAQGELNAAGKAYLKEAKNYYASSDSYKDIFSDVYSNINTLGSKTIVTPEYSNAPAVPEEVRAHNARVEALQSATIDELKLLRNAVARQILAAEDANEKSAEIANQLNKNRDLTERQMDELAQQVGS